MGTFDNKSGVLLWVFDFYVWVVKRLMYSWSRYICDPLWEKLQFHANILNKVTGTVQKRVMCTIWRRKLRLRSIFLSRVMSASVLILGYMSFCEIMCWSSTRFEPNNSSYTTSHNYYVVSNSCREDTHTSSVVYLHSGCSTWDCEDLMDREQTSLEHKNLLGHEYYR